MPLDFALGRKPPWWKRAGRWLWLPAVPAGALLAFVGFFALNRLGNELPSAHSTQKETSAVAEGAAEPANMTPPEEATTSSLYLTDPEVYFILWRSDTTAARAEMAALWRAELAQLKGATDAAEAGRAHRIAQAIERLEGVERP